MPFWRAAVTVVVAVALLLALVGWGHLMPWHRPRPASAQGGSLQEGGDGPVPPLPADNASPPGEPGAPAAPVTLVGGVLGVEGEDDEGDHDGEEGDGERDSDHRDDGPRKRHKWRGGHRD